MNVFSPFLIFPLRKFEAFRNYVYYSLVDRSINFFETSIGNQEMVITGLKPFTINPSSFENLIFPIIFNRDFLLIQSINYGRPQVNDINTNTTYSLSVLTFVRSHSANTLTAIVSASLINNKGILAYVKANTPRFEYGDTRQNLLSSTIEVPLIPTYFYESSVEGGIVHNRLIQQAISGTCLKNNMDTLPYTRLLYGWDGYYNGFHNLTITNDIPDELTGNLSQYFLLSSCQGSGGAGDSVTYMRNSPLGIALTTGSSAIPLIQYKEIGFTATQVNSQWMRYSITTPVAMWGFRRGAPTDGNRSTSSLWDRWTTFYEGTRPPISRGTIPVISLRMMQNPYGGLGAYAFWGPQLEYGEEATSYEYNAFAAVSGATNIKNMAPPLSSSIFDNAVTWWRYGNTKRIALTADTPFGQNENNPSYILQSTDQSGGAGLTADIHLRSPESSITPGTNLLRNTDFSGAEVGDVIQRSKSGNITDWFGDYKGRAPYWQDLILDLNETTIQIVSTGQINNCNFVDYRCFRTNTESTNNGYRGYIYFNPDWWQYVKASNGNTMTASISCALISGTIPGPAASPNDGRLLMAITYQGLDRSRATHNSPVNPRTNTFPGMNGSISKIIQASSLTDALTAISITATANDERISRVNFELRTDLIPAASTFDFVLRLCGPKLEKNSEPTPYIPTSTTLHTLTTMTFSCYIKYISGGQPTWEAPTTRGSYSGLIQRTSYVDPTQIRSGNTVTNSMYVKISGPGLPDSAKLKFTMGISDAKSKTFYATTKWQRVQYTNVYNRSDSSFDGNSDGRGFQFFVNKDDAENIGFDPNTTRFYFTGLQTELNTTATNYIPTERAKINTANTITGLLIEPERSNIALYSTNFTSTSVFNNNITYLPSVALAPDNSTLNSIISTTSNSNVLYLTGCNFSKKNKRYTVSFFVKTINTNTVLKFNQHAQHEASTITFTFDPTTSRTVVISQSNTTDKIGVERYINNWYRIYYTTVSSANNGKIWPGFSASKGTQQFYLWGLQIEEGDFPTSYIPVNNFIGVRQADILSLSGSNLWSVFVPISITNVSTNSATLYIESRAKFISETPQTLLQFTNKDLSEYDVIKLTTNATKISSNILDTNLLLDTQNQWFGNNIKTAFSFDNVGDKIVLGSNGRAVSGAITQNIQLSAINFGKNYAGYLRKILIFPDFINLNDLRIITT